MSTFQPIAVSAAQTIATYSLLTPGGLAVETGQAAHRVRLANFWRITPGSRVLEIGCGQGNCTAVLAEAVGLTGHVDAVDPGSPDYGAPFTLREAQAHISESAVGSRVAWYNAEPLEFLKEHEDMMWEYVVFAHCIWYFASPDLLGAMLKSLKRRVKQVLVAEYALTATEKDAQAHVLAARARSTLEAHNKTSEANIRSMPSPSEIKVIAESAGWNLDAEDIVVPMEDLLDGHWEVGSVKSQVFLSEINTHVRNEEVKAALHSAREEVIRAVEAQEGRRTRTMDVWAARFTST
ncbi:hypothetical protein AK830_g7012 [Neonectria ditissima]|uniref:Uncharacterized protein n=1 Tax=Neonectria ditissima TaxID=78410 RepID=A0A0N8H6P8_9HYPO|nr:hypothetical protein AK830_g7012 [Neonectria ditissima]